jgi:hypothetical protein
MLYLRTKERSGEETNYRKGDKQKRKREEQTRIRATEIQKETHNEKKDDGMKGKHEK